MTLKSICLVLALVAFTSTLNAQEDHEEQNWTSEQEGGEHLHHVIGFSIGHTHISTGFKDGGAAWLALPSFGLSYTYYFNKKWAIGLHNELIVEDFVIQSEDETVIERGRPLAVAVTGIYKIHKHVGLMAGAGMEFSSHEDFALVKIGAEFPYEFAHGWEMFGTLSADFKIDAYNSFSFGFGVARLF
jgi:hypothetical protein